MPARTVVGAVRARGAAVGACSICPPPGKGYLFTPLYSRIHGLTEGAVLGANDLVHAADRVKYVNLGLSSVSCCHRRRLWTDPTFEPRVGTGLRVEGCPTSAQSAQKSWEMAIAVRSDCG